MTAQDLISRSLTLCGRLGAGRGAGQSESSVALGLLNALIDSWNAQGLLVFSIRSDTYAMTIGKQAYTIGPGAADFNTTRPVHIEQANALVTVASQSVRVPMALLTAEQWAAVPATSDQSVLPQRLYDDYAAPISTLYVHPIPSAACSIELFTWQQLGAIAQLNDTLVLPPAFEHALAYNLAMELGPAFNLPPRPEVQALAAQAKAAIAELNARHLGIAPLTAAVPEQKTK
jgi:hypothetical protein